MKLIVSISTIAALSLLGTACARKKYVAQTVAPIDQVRETDTKKADQDQPISSHKSIEEQAPRTQEQLGDQAKVPAVEADRKAAAAVKAADTANTVANLARALKETNRYQVLKSEMVLFPVNQSTLTDDAKSQLQSLAKSVEGLDRYMIEVQGFTDKTGSATVNQRLSEQRAQEVARYLANKYKIPPRSISMVGNGYASPAMDSTTREGRMMNRRVEVRLYVREEANDSSLVHRKISPLPLANGLDHLRTSFQIPIGSNIEGAQPKLSVSPKLPLAPATEKVDEAIAGLSPGRITYDPPGQMTVGVTTSIQVRIIGMTADSQAEVSRVEPLLKNNMERAALPSRPLHVSQSMKVVLSGNNEEFKIDHDSKDSPETQAIGTQDTTEWIWTVTPLKSGKRRLHLSAVAIFNVGGKELQKQYAAYDTDIDVRVDRVGVITGAVHFVVDQWKAISGVATATGITAWVTAWLRKRRGQPGDPPDQAPAS